MTTSECEFGAGMGKSAVDYLYDFIILATRLSPEEQEVWNKLCRNRGYNAFGQKNKGRKNLKVLWKQKRREKMKTIDSYNSDFNPILIKEDTEPLTPKEEEVLNILMLGYGFEECARILDLSLTTIKTHIVHIYQKKHVSNLHQLTVKFYNPQLSESEKVGNFNKSDVLEIRNILGGS